MSDEGVVDANGNLWEWNGDPMQSIRNIEPLEFETVHLATRSYK